MATDKKTDKERTVKERLEGLYELQKLLSRIDEIKFQRGELPNEVKDLEDEIIRYQTRAQKYKDEVSDLRNYIAATKADIEDRNVKIQRYEEQLNDVKNNREYVFLEKEKEFESLEVEHDEKKIRDAEAKILAKEEEIKKTEEELTDNQHILEEKKKELEEIVSETRQEEETLRMKIKDLEPLIDQYTLNAFKRIRKNARNGLGIVAVQRNACGGCFNRIPPQRQLEIKMHKKVIVCEYCGRILIDSNLAGIEEPQEEAVQEKKKTKRASAKKA